jgi:hypothetical protein
MAARSSAVAPAAYPDERAPIGPGAVCRRPAPSRAPFGATPIPSTDSVPSRLAATPEAIRVPVAVAGARARKDGDDRRRSAGRSERAGDSRYGQGAGAGTSSAVKDLARDEHRGSAEAAAVNAARREPCASRHDIDATPPDAIRILPRTAAAKAEEEIRAEIAASEPKVLPLADGGDAFVETISCWPFPKERGLEQDGWRRFSSRTCGANVRADPGWPERGYSRANSGSGQSYGTLCNRDATRHWEIRTASNPLPPSLRCLRRGQACCLFAQHARGLAETARRMNQGAPWHGPCVYSP